MSKKLLFGLLLSGTCANLYSYNEECMQKQADFLKALDSQNKSDQIVVSVRKEAYDSVTMNIAIFRNGTNVYGSYAKNPAARDIFKSMNTCIAPCASSMAGHLNIGDRYDITL